MQPRTTPLHFVLYTSFLWLIGGLLAVVYGLTHNVGDLRVYQIVIDQPQQRHHEANAADIFSVVDEEK